MRFRASSSSSSPDDLGGDDGEEEGGRRLLRPRRRRRRLLSRRNFSQSSSAGTGTYDDVAAAAEAKNKKQRLLRGRTTEPPPRRRVARGGVDGDDGAAPSGSGTAADFLFEFGTSGRIGGEDASASASATASESAAAQAEAPSSLPVLLRLREAFGVAGGRPLPPSTSPSTSSSSSRPCRRDRWEKRILRRRPAAASSTSAATTTVPKTTGINETRRRRREWRPTAVRSVPFSLLRTPPTDAVLAMDRWGSYVLSLGGGGGAGGGAGRSRETSAEARDGVAEADRSSGRPRRISGPPPALALKFYGIPSPASLERRHRARRPKRRRGGALSLPPPLFSSSDRYDAPPHLLLTVPLLTESSDSDENRNFTAPSSIVGLSSCAAATTPVRILTSGDGAMGAAFLGYSTASFSAAAGGAAPPSSAATAAPCPATREEDLLGTIVVFPLPFSNGDPSSRSLLAKGGRRRVPRIVKSYRCANVRVGGWRAHTMRNLLWPVSLVPMAPEKEEWGGREGACDGALVGGRAPLLCDAFLETSRGTGYLLLNDEDDGFRMTWFVFAGSAAMGGGGRLVNAEDVIAAVSPARAIRPKRSDIVQRIPAEESAWEEVRSDASTGRTVPTESIPRRCDGGGGGGGGSRLLCGGIEVVFEAYLNVEALLGDIVGGHRKLLSPMLLGGESSSRNRGGGGVDDKEQIRRRGRVALPIPNFFYNLISVSEEDRTVVLVIVIGGHFDGSDSSFSAAEGEIAGDGSDGAAEKKKGVRGKKGSGRRTSPAAVGIFVRLNVIDQSYEEMEWVQHPSRSDGAFLRRWSNALASNWRMREVGAGPFSVAGWAQGTSVFDPKQQQRQRQQGQPHTAALRNFGVWIREESNWGESEADDFDPDLWEELLLASSEKKRGGGGGGGTGRSDDDCDGGGGNSSKNVTKKKKEVSASSLYPYCNFISNRAVTSGVPVRRIACRKAPVELVYG